jgi:hypothetical protein
MMTGTMADKQIARTKTRLPFHFLQASGVRGRGQGAHADAHGDFIFYFKHFL